MTIRKMTPGEVKNLSYEQKLKRIEDISSALTSNFSPRQIKEASISKLYPESKVIRAVDNPLNLVGAKFGTKELLKERQINLSSKDLS